MRIGVVTQLAGLRVARPERTTTTPITKAELRALMHASQKNGHLLDLRGQELAHIDFQNGIWTGLLFASNHHDTPATLPRRFARATFIECFFTGLELDNSDFDSCQFDRCDLRFTVFSRARLGHSRFTRCDMFAATLAAGTIVSGMRFVLSSLPELGDGIVGLGWDCFQGEEGKPAFIGEDRDEYERFLMRTAGERQGGVASLPDALERRLDGVADSLRRLSGHWTRQAQFADANCAYVLSRRVEREAAAPKPSNARKRPIRWAALWLADLTCEFGQNLGRVFACLLFVAFGPGLMFIAFGGINGAHIWPDDLLFSSSRLTDSTPGWMTPANAFVSWVGVAQTFVGVSLLGLFGFVLGNTLRQS
jgi:hypothetical protein